MENELRYFLEKIQYLPDSPDLEDDLLELEKRIELLFSRIRSTSTVVEAMPYFNDLANIQSTLCILTFKEGKRLAPNLREFVRDFERLDTIPMQDYLFDKIKSVDYSKRWLRKDS